MENFVLEPTELANERPNLEFEDGLYSIPEILDSHLLPLVVQNDSGGQPPPFNKLHFDLTQPLLLYKKRNIQKVAATSLHIKDEKYEELGESLLIPEDYKGWFAVLQRLTGYTKADDTVPHFASVEELANSNTEKFLIGGTKKISGLQILDRSEGHIKHEQRHFFPGDALTVEKVEFGEAKKRTRLFRKPKYIREKFLLCTDETDREVLLPFEQQGIFYQISHKSGKPVKNVMQMSDIVARKLTPRIIKLVFGRFPVTPCAFTGLMKAESSRIETSVIASTIVNKQNILMEIPINNEIFFKIAVTNDHLRQNACYQNAMHFCAERASTYMRNIKLCYNFALRGTGSNDFILKTPPPETSAPLDYIAFGAINKGSAVNEDNIDADNKKGSMRHSDISDISEVSIRPGRCASTSRMSFCLGNSYLTVPVFDSIAEKRNSGNNNTMPEMPHTAKGCTQISFNGKFLEIEGGILREEEESSTPSPVEDSPPPIACTNTNSHINIVRPPNTEVNPEFPDYIPTSLSRRPSSQPPDTAPPPIPLSWSTSGVSSGSVSSVSDGVSSKRASTDSFEYDVPKTDSSGSSSSSVSRATITSESNATSDSGALTRRPSTYTFAEGCVPVGRSFSKKHVELMEELEESSVDADSPIYENIQSLMEICKKLDLECGHMENADSDSELTRSTSEVSLTEMSELKDDREILCDDKDRVCVPNEYIDSPLVKNDEVVTITEESGVLETNTHNGCRNHNTHDGEMPTPSHSCSTLSASPKSIKSFNSDSIQTEEKVVRVETKGMTSESSSLACHAIENTENKCFNVNSNATSANQHNIDEEKTSSSSSEKKEFVECSDISEESSEGNVVQSCVIVDNADTIIDKTEPDMAINFKDTKNSNEDTHGICEDVETNQAKNGIHADQECKIESNAANTEAGGASNEGNFTICDTGDTSSMFRSYSSPSGGTDAKNVSTSVSAESASPINDETIEAKESWQCALRKVRKTKSLNSANADSVREFPSDPEELSRLSSAEVREHFKSIGIRDATLAKIEMLDINGSVLHDVLNGERTLRESMSSVNLIDQQKISMYIRGWRPQTE